MLKHGHQPTLLLCACRSRQPTHTRRRVWPAMGKLVRVGTRPSEQFAPPDMLERAPADAPQWPRRIFRQALADVPRGSTTYSDRPLRISAKAPYPLQPPRISPEADTDIPARPRGYPQRPPRISPDAPTDIPRRPRGYPPRRFRRNGSFPRQKKKHPRHFRDLQY